MKRERFLINTLKNKLKRGSIIIEALLALAIGSTILTVVSSALMGTQQTNLQANQYEQAELLLQEGQEVVRSVWSTGWLGIDVAGLRHPVINSGEWVLAPGSEDLGIYSRQIEINSVSRDTQGNIVTEGGTLDPATKKVTVIVSWDSPMARSISQTFYLTRYLENLSWKEDTAADFSDGQENATDVTTNPGNIQLAQTGGGGWTQPRSLGTVDGRYKSTGICLTSQYAYLTWDHEWGGIEVFDIHSNPVAPVSVGNFGLTYRANDCITANGYLYIADSWFLPTISIYNIGANPTNPPFVGITGILYSAGGLWATDQYLFVSVKNTNIIVVYGLDDGHYTNPQFLGFFFTPHEAVDLTASGNYLYVAQRRTAGAVEIYDISQNPTAPTHVGTVNTLYQPTGIWTESNILYLSMESKRGAMFSIANPVSPRLYGYFPTVRNTVDVAAYGDYGYIAGTDSQLKVIEVFDLSDSKGISGIYFVYGEYISSTFDAGSQVVFNRLSWQGSEPTGTNILFQIAVSDDGTTWNFVGPDGSSGSYYDSSNAIPLSHTLGRYFKYKAILTGDGDFTPVVAEVTVNYSK
jgi:hypothetical protein